MKGILESNLERTPFELIGFAINLAANDQIAEIICHNSGLKFLIRKAAKTRNILLWKMINNISIHEGTKTYFMV